MKVSQLYWQCRRGSLELDLLLKNYLENDYVNATKCEREKFAELLKLEDDELFQAFIDFRNGSLI